MNKKTLSNEDVAYEKLTPLARKAVKCNECFKESASLKKADRIERPEYPNLAQPRYIGEGYWTAKHRVAFIMVNPGVDKKKDDKWQDLIEEFKNSKVSLKKVFDEQGKYLDKVWADGDIKKFIKLHGLDLEKIALVNIAWCAAKENKHPWWMLSKCFEKHTFKWLQYLKPDIVILSGQATEPFEFAFSSHFWAPSIKIFTTYHYAYWRRQGKAKAEEKAGEVEKQLYKIGAI